MCVCAYVHVCVLRVTQAALEDLKELLAALDYIAKGRIIEQVSVGRRERGREGERVSSTR